MPFLLWYALGVVTFFSITLSIVFRLEKRMVWPYGELEATPYFGDPTGYGDRWVKDAVQAGFLMLGWARDIKGPTYRASYAMLVSPERDTFAVVGVGTVLNIRVQSTSLYNPTADGRTFCTTDNQTSVQIDLSGNWPSQLCPEPNFDKLLQKHREWVRDCGVLPRPFTRGREYVEFRCLREEHFRSMERVGLIRFTDPSAARFQFTLPGAAKTATWGYFVGMARKLSLGRFPRTA